MPLSLLTDLPRYECLLDAAERFPSLDPRATEAYLHLLRTSDLVFSAADKILSDRGVSQARFSILLLLHRGCGGPLTPAQIADKIGVARATVTGVLDTLEKDGFVRRDPDPVDRRTINIFLTPEGVTFLEGVLPPYFSKVAEIMHPLQPEEQQTLVRLLQKLQEPLSAPPGPDTQPTGSNS
jgi:DNA-binding MarR family transcriptional regulator